jgi:hypothetical protein
MRQAWCIVFLMFGLVGEDNERLSENWEESTITMILSSRFERSVILHMYTVVTRFQWFLRSLMSVPTVSPEDPL